MVTSSDSRTRMALSPRCALPFSERKPFARPVASMPTKAICPDSETSASGARFALPPSSLTSAIATVSDRWTFKLRIVAKSAESSEVITSGPSAPRWPRTVTS